MLYSRRDPGRSLRIRARNSRTLGCSHLPLFRGSLPAPLSPYAPQNLHLRRLTKFLRLLRHPPYHRSLNFLKAWHRLIAIAGLLALPSYPEHKCALPRKCEESPVRRPKRKPHDDAAAFRDAPIAPLPHHLDQFSSFNRLLPPPGLGERDSDPAAVRILVVLLMLNCWRSSVPQLVRT